MPVAKPRPVIPYARNPACRHIAGVARSIVVIVVVVVVIVIVVIVVIVVEAEHGEERLMIAAHRVVDAGEVDIDVNDVEQSPILE